MLPSSGVAVDITALEFGEVKQEKRLDRFRLDRKLKLKSTTIYLMIHSTPTSNLNCYSTTLLVKLLNNKRVIGRWGPNRVLEMSKIWGVSEREV